ncbi:HNH endonuclease [Roseovarius sp. THAF8]|uniref:HNH endonuclease n=1 Tax=Roseovarius sp. THAF8 TaxID=2587846 RepID=UPI0012AAA384|nr:HNH endonuclease [Roseovarius sp. THAF8]QFT97992.1 HNH endonuclease [Roseovarius sp. THAF8]
MIKLSKVPEPEILTNNKEAWTRDLLDAVESEDKDAIRRLTKRYNHPQVKAALKQETNEKCAYCEAKVTDVAHGDIEHVTPKSLNRDLTFEWQNLTFACQVCNQKKSNKDNILDPYNVDPDEHLFFVGAFAKGKTEDGVRTVLELELNRVPLIESRNREIERYADQLEKIFLVHDKDTRELLIKGMKTDLDSRRPEFIAACQNVLQQHIDANA